MRKLKWFLFVWLCVFALGAGTGMAYADDDGGDEGGGDEGGGDEGGGDEGGGDEGGGDEGGGDEGGGGEGGGGEGGGGEGGGDGKDNFSGAFSFPAPAWRTRGADYERAHQALTNGEILPMIAILELLDPQVRADIIDMELEFEHQKWVYEFKYLNTSGKLTDYYVDAATGQHLPGWADEQ